jgi:hypothetical protein
MAICHMIRRAIRRRRAAAVQALAAALLAALPAAAWAEAGLRADYLCKGRFDVSVLTAFFFNGTPSAVVLLEGEGRRACPGP